MATLDRVNGGVLRIPFSWDVRQVRRSRIDGRAASPSRRLTSPSSVPPRDGGPPTSRPPKNRLDKTTFIDGTSAAPAHHPADADLEGLWWAGASLGPPTAFKLS